MCRKPSLNDTPIFQPTTSAMGMSDSDWPDFGFESTSVSQMETSTSQNKDRKMKDQIGEWGGNNNNNNNHNYHNPLYKALIYLSLFLSFYFCSKNSEDSPSK